MKQNALFVKSLFRRAVFPGIITILSVNINVIADGILVGRKIGSEALAAINLNQPLILFMCVIGSFFAAGTTINAAHELGQNHVKKAADQFSTCALLLLVMSAVVTVIGLLFKNQLVDLLCSDDTLRYYVMEYYLITVIGALPKIMIYVPLWFLRLDGENTAVMIMMGVMSIGNIILDILMVYVWDMGVFGAGLSSLAANGIATLLGVIWLYAKKSVFRFKFHIISDLDSWKNIAVAGVPSALNHLASAIRIFLINAFLLRFGGGALVAVFSAINGVYGFGEGIVLGIPQAASSMLGVYYGEKDNDSCAIILKLEFMYGAVLSAAYLVLITLGSHLIQSIYNMETSLLIPLLWLGLSVVFATTSSVLQGYYNVSKNTMWSNLQILLRTIVGTIIGLLMVEFLGFSTFSFLFTAEAAALIIWYIAAMIAYKNKPKRTKFFFMDRFLEETGKVLNFSVENNADQICEASERISEFCNENGLSSSSTMTIKLSIEEMLTAISDINERHGNKNTIQYDLRAYSVSGLQGLRIRYNGIYINPFIEENYEKDSFLGVHMITKLVKDYGYYKVMGSNMVTLLLEVKDGDDPIQEMG